MADKNTKEVNRIVAKTLVACSIATIILLTLSWFHVYNFSSSIRAIIIVIGFFTTITPVVLLELGVNDYVLKYYMLMMLSLLIGALGTFNEIGIYISFVLVPIVSALYFDRKFTLRISIFAYIVMVLAVYFNSAGKMEVTYYHWSHLVTFRNYMIGFTIEYVIVMLFVYHVVSRAQHYMEKQNTTLKDLKQEEIKFSLLRKGSKDIVFQYDIKEDYYSANKSIFRKSDEEPQPVEITNFNHYVNLQKGSFHLIGELLADCLETEESLYREYDFSYEENGVPIPLWYQAEAFILRDEKGEPTNIVGKLHDITRVKENQASITKQKISSVYLESMAEQKRSIYQEVMEASDSFTEEEYSNLAIGHNLIAQLLEMLRYSKNLKKDIQDIFDILGKHYGVDRIYVVDIDMKSGVSMLSYQWNSEDAPQIEAFVHHLSKEERKMIFDRYNTKGYIELNPIEENFSSLRTELFERYTKDTFLGNQLWIPMMMDGEYSGAVCFDRYDITSYSLVDKFILSEIVQTLSAYIARVRAEEARDVKGAFLSNMSHEIRRPMNAIFGITEVALRENISDQTKECLQIVKASAAGMLTMVNDMLDVSKIEAGRMEISPERYETHSLLSDVYALANARNSSKKLNLSFHVDENLPVTLEGDLVRIKQVLINLIDNAIKYTDEGSVDIYFNCEGMEDEQTMLHFSVQDTGQGFQEDDLDKLFKNYGQIKKIEEHYTEGTGLGLAICKQLIEQMNGFISVKSSYGEGSTFSVDIPQRIIEQTPIGDFEKYLETLKNKDGVSRLKDAKVLLVDNNEMNRMVEVALLAPLKMQLVEAKSGMEALELLNQEKFDLVLMDYFMPGMDGEQATKILRGMEDCQNKDVPVIALTADAVSGVREKLLDAGINDVISKPINYNFTVTKICQWMKKED